MCCFGSAFGRYMGKNDKELKEQQQNLLESGSVGRQRAAQLPREKLPCFVKYENKLSFEPTQQRDEVLSLFSSGFFFIKPSRGKRRK